MRQDSLPVSIVQPRDGLIETPWFNAKTFTETDARRLGPDVVQVRAWLDPTKPGSSRVTMETVYRPLADPSLPDRELDRLVPSDHPVGKRVGDLITALARVYGPQLSDSTRETPFGIPGRTRWQTAFRSCCRSRIREKTVLEYRVPSTEYSTEYRENFAPVASLAHSRNPNLPPVAPLLSWTSRRTGRTLAGLAALISFGIAIYTAISQVDRVLHIYDGLWMLGGTAVATGDLCSLVWSWPRDKAIALLALVTVIASWTPLVALALRAKIPILARLKGAVFFSSADVVGVALPVGVVCLYLAVKEYRRWEVRR